MSSVTKEGDIRAKDQKEAAALPADNSRTKHIQKLHYFAKCGWQWSYQHSQGTSSQRNHEHKLLIRNRNHSRIVYKEFLLQLMQKIDDSKMDKSFLLFLLPSSPKKSAKTKINSEIGIPICWDM